MTRLIILFLTLFLSSCNENIEQSYMDYEDFKNSTEGDKSWFPNLITQDSYNIKEVHNLDNNNSFGVFNYKKAPQVDSLTLGPRTKKITEQEFTTFLNKINSPKRPDWFLNLKADIAHIQFFEKNNMVIAKDQTTKKIYFAYSSW